MDCEIEVKLRLAGPETLRRRLAESGASCEGRIFERNRIFDGRAASLRARGCAIRLREEAPSPDDPPSAAKLTFKGPRAPGPLKIRPEMETQIGDAKVLTAILGELGLSELVYYEKWRETWRLQDCEIVIDELPRLGWFCEIEGPSADAVEAMRPRLGLEAAEVCAESYVELTITCGEPEQGARRSLRFESNL